MLSLLLSSSLLLPPPPPPWRLAAFFLLVGEADEGEDDAAADDAVIISPSLLFSHGGAIKVVIAVFAPSAFCPRNHFGQPFCSFAALSLHLLSDSGAVGKSPSSPGGAGGSRRLFFSVRYL